MTSDRPIDRNRDALLSLMAKLCRAAGIWQWVLGAGGAVGTMPRYVHRNVLRVLLPAESAVRRLIVVAARGIRLSPRAARPFPGIESGTGVTPDRLPGFPLFDRRKTFLVAGVRRAAGAAPGLWVIGETESIGRELPSRRWSDDPVDAGRLCRRIQALHKALDEIPRHARRMARAMQRCKAAPVGPRRMGPLRVGLPPGYRARRRVDEILGECHERALYALAAPDSS